MYIGRGVDAISNVSKLTNLTFDGGTTYALVLDGNAFTPVGANNILVSIDGVIQQGNFSVSTTNIVFDWSPTSSNTCNFILHYGTGVLNVPADGSIVAAKMAANSVDSDSYVDGSIDAVHLSANSVDSDAYVDGSIDTAHIGATQVTGAKLNTDVISAQTALAVEPADTDEFMVSDGGVLKRIDYSLIKGGGITEADTWRLSSSLTLSGSVNTWYYITTNWARCTGDGFGQLGTGLTESSGVFSFPSTGYWLIDHWFNLSANTGAIQEWYISLHTTLDNSSYGEATFTISSQSDTNYATSSHKRFVFDVTNTTNCKFKFKTYYSTANNTIQGDGSYNFSGFDVVRLADT